MNEKTIVQIVEARNLDDYTKNVYDWAEYLWDAWEEHHMTIRGYVNLLEVNKRK